MQKGTETTAKCSFCYVADHQDVHLFLFTPAPLRSSNELIHMNDMVDIRDLIDEIALFFFVFSCSEILRQRRKRR